VSRMLALDDRFGGTSSLLYFDFENLAALAKAGNRDVYNRAVLTIAKTLAGHVRNCDVVGKIGPSEFGVLLTRCDNVNAWKRAEVLSVNAQHQLALVTGSEFKAQVGFGVHSFHGQGDVAEGLRMAASALTRKS
jgi:GGDEF domain-containing protein